MSFSLVFWHTTYFNGIFFCSVPKKFYTVNEALALISDECDDVVAAEIFIAPPDNLRCSDKDSGNEDSGGIVDNLTHRQQRAEANIILHTAHDRIRLRKPEELDSEAEEQDKENMEDEDDDKEEEEVIEHPAMKK